MKLRTLILTLVLLAPSGAFAGPFTAGAWSPASSADADLGPFWDGLSSDCFRCGIGYLLVQRHIPISNIFTMVQVILRCSGSTIRSSTGPWSTA